VLDEKSPRGNTPLGDETTLHRDYVGIQEKCASKERSVAGTIRGKSKKDMKKEVRADAK
jgi:hypothetical protein